MWTVTQVGDHIEEIGGIMEQLYKSTFEMFTPKDYYVTIGDKNADLLSFSEGVN